MQTGAHGAAPSSSRCLQSFVVFRVPVSGRIFNSHAEQSLMLLLFVFCLVCWCTYDCCRYTCEFADRTMNTTSVQSKGLSWGLHDVAHVSCRRMSWCGVQVFLDSFPQLVGTQYGDLVCRFSDGLVLGLLNRRSGACDIAPPAETLVSWCHQPTSLIHASCPFCCGIAPIIGWCR